MRRHHVGQRVNVTAGPFAGAQGRITEPAQPRLRPRFEWCVRFYEPVVVGKRLYFSSAVAESELAAYTVPESARPVSVGVLAGGGR